MALKLYLRGLYLDTRLGHGRISRGTDERACGISKSQIEKRNGIFTVSRVFKENLFGISMGLGFLSLLGMEFPRGARQHFCRISRVEGGGSEKSLCSVSFWKIACEIWLY